MKESLLIKGATVITLDKQNHIFEGDVLIERGRIASLGEPVAVDQKADEVIDARGLILLPGFVQTHVHLCQTLFRGAADDLALIDWLKKRIWPMEAAHTPESLYASARLGIAELIRGGTTCALDDGDGSIIRRRFSGRRGVGVSRNGRQMHDGQRRGCAGWACMKKTDDSIAESLALLEGWHGRADGRIRYCFRAALRHQLHSRAAGAGGPAVAPSAALWFTPMLRKTSTRSRWSSAKPANAISNT